MDEAMALALPLIRRWEGYSSTPYLCPAGYWTIGYGTLCKQDSAAATRELAEQWLSHGVAQRFASACRQSPVLWTASPRRQAAMMSWLYNLGVGNYAASTLRRRVNEGDWTGAAQECRRWTFAGGRRLSGLVARRAEESLMLAGGDL
jgi:lysozyme